MAETYDSEAWRATERTGPWARLLVEIEAEQDRWFLWLPVMFGVGIALYFRVPDEPPLFALTAAAIIAFVLHLFGRRAQMLGLVTGALAAITFGALGAIVRTEIVRAPVLERQMSSVDVTGFVELVEPRATRGQRITLMVLSLGKMSDSERPHRVRVRTLTTDPTLRPGDAVRLRATLGPPPWPAAPGDYDFGRQAWFSGLGGIGLAIGSLQRLDDAPAPPLRMQLRAPIERLRQAIRQRIVAALPGETGEIATALITGERGGISEATNQAYRDSGLFHILSISGLHMVIMAGAVFWLLRLMLAAMPSIALRYPIKKWAAVGAILGGFAYLLISGGAPATVRSWIMLTIMFVAVLLDRPALALRNVAIAALLILVLLPESLFDAGFQMSFAAVTGLISAYEYLRHRREALERRTAGEQPGVLANAFRFIAGIFVSTLIASFAVAPFGIYHFHNTQLLALIANLFAIPICNMIVMPAALAVLMALPFGLEVVPLTVMGLGIDAMSWVARWVGAMPGAVVKVPAIPTLAFVLLIGGGLWLLLWSRPWRMLGLVPMALGLLLTPTQARPDLYVGRDGTTVAVRGADGRLAALASRGSAFELARWLELDGDRRAAADVADAKAFRCDAVGCTARSQGRLIAVALSPAALRDDCLTADVLIVRFVVPRPCPTSQRAGQIVIAPTHLARAGAHAVTIDARGAHLETVADVRGRRPWSGPLVDRIALDADSRIATGRLAGFSALFERFRAPRPEVDDEIWPRGRPQGEDP